MAFLKVTLKQMMGKTPKFRRFSDRTATHLALPFPKGMKI